MTQTQEIIYRLEMGPVCSTDLLRMFIPRAAARVHDLRNQGRTITTRPCTRDHHHKTKQIEYVLEEGKLWF